MPDTLERLPPSLMSAEERRIRDRMAAEARPGFLQATQDAITSEWVTSFLARQFGDPQIPTPGFSRTAERIEELGKDIPVEYWGSFSDAVSEPDALRIRENLLGLSAARARLGSLGWKGGALRIVSNVLDPIGLAAAIASGPFGISAKAGKLTAFVKAGAMSAGAEAAISGYRASQDPEYDAYDALAAMGAAFALGGGVGLWHKYGLDKAGLRLQRAAEFNALSKAVREGGTIENQGKTLVESGVLTDAGKQYFRETIAAQAGITEAQAKKVLTDDQLELIAENEAAAQVWAKFRAEEATASLGEKAPFNILDLEANIAKLRAAEAAAPPGLSRVLDRAVDTRTLTKEEAQSVLGNAAFVETPGRISTIHLTDNPEPVIEGLRGGRSISETREGGDIGPGLYASAAPQLWTGRSRNKWDFLQRLDQPKRQELADAIGKKLLQQRQDGYNTQAEFDYAMRDLDQWVETGLAPEPVADLATQPFNIAFWKPEFLDPLGIQAGKQPLEIPMELEGRFARLKRTPSPEEVEGLKQSGFDGAFFSGGISEPPQIVVWNNNAVVRFGDYTKPSVSLGTTPAGSIPTDLAALRAAEAAAPPETALGATAPGAPALTPRRVRQNVDELILENVSTDVGGASYLTVFGKKVPLRFGMVGSLTREDMPDFVRGLARSLAQDALPTKIGDPTNLAATEWVKWQMVRQAVPALKQADEQFAGWARAQGIGINPISRARARGRFNSEVSKAIRRPAGSYTTDPHINAVADSRRGYYGKFNEFLGLHGVKGFEGGDIPLDDLFVPRRPLSSKVLAAITTHGRDAVEDLIAASIASGRTMNGLAALDAKQLLTRARGYLYTIEHMGDGFPMRQGVTIAKDQADRIAEALRARVPGIGDDEIKDALILAGLRSPDTAAPVVSKFRTVLDETSEVGTPAGRLTFEDLLENDADELLVRYTRNSLGSAAFAEIARTSKKSADDLIDTPEALMNRVRASLSAHRDLSPERRAAAEKKIQTLLDMVLGRPMGENTKIMNAIRGARDWNFARLGGSFGFAQLAEVGEIIAHYGWDSIVAGVPALRALLGRAVRMDIRDEFVDEIAGLVSESQSYGLHRLTNRFEDIAAAEEHLAGPVRRTMRGAHIVVSEASGMAPITRFLQDWSAISAAQRWIRYAKSGRIPSEYRLAQMGLRKADAEKIIEQINLNKHFDVDAFGRKRRTLGLDDWDLDTKAKFVTALHKWGRQTVQMTDPGQMAAWMTTDGGRLIIQFRSFAIAAWEQKFLANVAAHDRTAAMSFFLTMFFGGLAYMGQTYVNSAGRADREKFLKERLTAKNISLAAFNRSGWSSLFPIGFDTMFQTQGLAAPFSFAKRPGFERDPLFGNPTLDLFANMKRSLELPRILIDDERDFDKGYMAAFRPLIWGQSLPGVRNALDAIQTRLPE